MPDQQTMSLVMNTYGVNSGNSGGFSAANILIALLFGIIGLYAFNYGRKEKNYRPLVIGLLLMGYPYFVSNVWVMLVIGCALTTALFMWRE